MISALKKIQYLTQGCAGKWIFEVVSEQGRASKGRGKFQVKEIESTRLSDLRLSP